MKRKSGNNKGLRGRTDWVRVRRKPLDVHCGERGGGIATRLSGGLKSTKNTRKEPGFSWSLERV